MKDKVKGQSDILDHLIVEGHNTDIQTPNIGQVTLTVPEVAIDLGHIDTLDLGQDQVQGQEAEVDLSQEWVHMLDIIIQKENSLGQDQGHLHMLNQNRDIQKGNNMRDQDQRKLDIQGHCLEVALEGCLPQRKIVTVILFQSLQGEIKTRRKNTSIRNISILNRRKV